MHEDALAIRRKVLGDEHPDVAQSLNNLALLLQAQVRSAGSCCSAFTLFSCFRETWPMLSPCTKQPWL